ncbi:DNA topoisomerase 2-binding protein 1-A-like [Anopheles albimanus]|uniref:BRCT domain-containing protein n=1 Tax=Anopheles albimanus TaxID=7167 RepID=A0A182FRE9_ANOAL|nr:DNA topoisomerase 2-binding protein 1-A-like [Anopheles albimanus]
MSSVSMIAEQQLAKLYFVLPAGEMADENASEDMKMAYTTAREHHDNEQLQEWISEGDCLKLKEAEMSKKHVFVFEKFSGPAFDRANKAQSTVIGPRCLISCFMGNETIPLGKHPVFTTAMRNLTVCSSGLKTKEKAHISQLVFYMGGYYMDVLNGSCTHLVASTVKSVKYEEAAKIKLPILHPDWVQEVWDVSQKRDVNATDEPFMTRHRLPVFYSLTVTSTGLPVNRKNEIKSLIEANGGNYIGAFKSEITDILILERSSQGTAKFQAAVRSKKECLTPEWIEDSVVAGFALPIRGYEVRTIKASTPTKDDPAAGATATAAASASRARSSDFNPDCTELSEISHANFSGRNLTINESVMSSAGGKDDNAVKSQQKSRPVGNAYREVLVRITVQQAKKAGPLLDGCSVYLSGFTNDEKDKLNKILNALGAVRYDEHSAAVSHVIVGEQLASEMRQLRDSSAHLLTLDWLAKSIEEKQLVPEESTEYTFRPSGKSGIVARVPEPPSPSSKQNLERLNSDVFKRPKIPKFRLDDGTPTTTAGTQEDAGTPQEPMAPVASAEQQSIMMQYLEANKAEQLPPSASQKDSIIGIPVPVASSTALSSGSQYDDSEVESNVCSDFMLGRTLFVFGFPEEDAQRIVDDLKQCGGTIVDESYHDEVDFIVLPTSCIGTVDFTIRGRHMVNCIWLETSIQEGECQPMEYFYEPIIYGEADPRPLEGETLVISSYSGAERSFLIQLGSILGACVQERLVRKAAPLLVCKEPSGAKYNAAIQWSLTVVSAEWLRECMRQKRRVAENPFLVGDSVCSPKNIPDDAGGGCLPTTSTDELDLDTMRAEAIPPDYTDITTPTLGSRARFPSKTPLMITTADERDLDTLRAEGVPADRTGVDTPNARCSRMHFPPNDNLAISGAEEQFRYITEKKKKDESGFRYTFNSLSTPELRKMSPAEWKVYSKELDQYGEMIAVECSKRKPCDPNDTTAAGCRTPASRVDSPVAGAGQSSSCSSAQGTPVTAGEYEALSVTQRVQEFETPVRSVLYRALKEAEENDRKLTPRTRRMQELLATPAAGGMGAGLTAGHVRTPTLPDCMTKPVTPYGYRPDASPENHAYHKRKLQYWDRFYKGKRDQANDGAISNEGETPSQQNRRLSTPLSEFKRRFYRDNLGEDYVNQIESRYNTQYPEGGRQEQSSAKQPMLDNPEEEEIAETQASPRPKATAVPPQSRIAGQEQESVSGSNRQESAKGANVSAEKRSRRAMEEEEENQQPVVVAVADENVRKFCDFISATRDSAKKKAKYHTDTEDAAGVPLYTELEAYDSELPGVGGVVWRDRGSENVQPEEKVPSPHTAEASHDNSNDSRRESVERGDAPKRMLYRGTPLFAISGVSEEMRVQLVQHIQELKGEVADLSRYDPACTHVISSRPNRGEKTLSAIAAGKWVLSTKYIEDSLQAGFFLEEESYEWGNPRAVANLTPLDSTTDNETATASYTWRKRIATDGGKRDGAFTGFRVLLVPTRKATLVRLLQSGGGHVLDCDPPFIDSEEAMTATHCFVDRKATLSNEDQQVLGEAGVSVLSIMYLNAYLTSPKLPAENEFRLSA